MIFLPWISVCKPLTIVWHIWHKTLQAFVFYVLGYVEVRRQELSHTMKSVCFLKTEWSAETSLEWWNNGVSDLFPMLVCRAPLWRWGCWSDLMGAVCFVPWQASLNAAAEAGNYSRKPQLSRLWDYITNWEVVFAKICWAVALELTDYCVQFSREFLGTPVKDVITAFLLQCTQLRRSQWHRLPPKVSSCF